ncbi:hypothetical protein G7032_06665, partial [Pseudomonas monteilii]|uniref:hypothetical protein n=1 Tax=Pseudomonas monteilii TaxID=76759 RepID=UPI0015E3C055
FLGHLLDRFDLELFGVTLTTHGTSYLGLIMRLGGVYETRGDSLNLIKYSGGDKKAFKKYQEIYQQTHKLKVDFFENSEIIKFTSTETNESILFRTASIREGGARLKEERQNQTEAPFNDTGLNKNKPYNPEPSEQITNKSKGVKYA